MSPVKTAHIFLLVRVIPHKHCRLYTEVVKTLSFYLLSGCTAVYRISTLGSSFRSKEKRFCTTSTSSVKEVHWCSLIVFFTDKTLVMHFLTIMCRRVYFSSLIMSSSICFIRGVTLLFELAISSNCVSIC